MGGLLWLPASSNEQLFGFAMNVEQALTHMFIINKSANDYYNVHYEKYSQRIWYLPNHPNDEVAIIL